jgi:molecular chaperone GrpE
MLMADPDPNSTAAAEKAGRADSAHGTAFTAETTPQSSVNEPDPFNELENLYVENAGLKDKILRTLADMENLRRRTEKETADAKTYAVAAFAREMLSFADNLSRAISSVPEEARASAAPAVKSFIEGMELTERDFLACLSRRGVKKLEPLGQRFDPNFHEALFEVPDASVPAGTVVQVVEAGYQIGDRVLRPAKVGVARGGPKLENASGA